MEVDEAVRFIEKRIAANFASAPLAFNNEPPQERQDPYVRVTVQVGATNPSLDSGYERTRGIVYLDARVPKGRGDLLAWSLAREAARVLTYKTFDGVRCTSADYNNLGTISDALEIDSGWYQIQAMVPFWFENYPDNS